MNNSTSLENLRKLHENRCNQKIYITTNNGRSLMRQNYHEDTVDALKLWQYFRNDVETTKKCCETAKNKIKKVIFNDPATIVLWGDGSKTVVKCSKDEKFDPEKGLAMAISKHFLGTNKSKSNYYDIFEEWLPIDVDKIIEKAREEANKQLRIIRTRIPIVDMQRLKQKETDKNGAENNN